MEQEETDIADIEIIEPERIKLSDRECTEFIAFGRICDMGKVKLTMDDRMNAVNQSLIDFPGNTLDEHKSNICKTHYKTINEKVIAVHEPGYTERNTIISNNTRKMKKINNKHYPSQLAAQNKKSKDKQRDNESDSWKKEQDHKKVVRDAHKLIKDDPGTINCPLCNGRCARTSHKTSFNHIICPLSLKFNMLEGKCYWNTSYGL